MTAVFVAGCALIERDVDHANDLTVATIGTDIRITKGQLTNAFNNQGHQYMQQGMTTREAVERTLDDLIDREILVELSIQNFSMHLSSAQISNMRGKTGLDSLYYNALYENEKAEVRRDVFSALDGFYRQLQDRVRDERNLTFRERDGAEDPNLFTPTSAMDPFRPFDPLVRRNQANSTFTMDISTQVNREFLLETNQDGSPLIPTTWSPDIDENGDAIVELVKTEALVRLVRVLTNNERGMRAQSMTEESLVENQKLRGEEVLSRQERALIGRELARMINEQSKTVLVRRFQDNFELGLDTPIDRSHFPRVSDYEEAVLAAIRSNSNGTDVRQTRARDLATQAQNFYRSQIMSQYNRFVRGIDTMDSLANNVLDSLGNVFWLPTDVAQNHFTVSHILIQYNDAQTAELARIKSDFQQGRITAATYNARKQSLAANLTVRARDEDGVEYGPERTAIQVRDEIVAALGGTAVNVPQAVGSFEMRTPAVSGAAEEQRRINTFRDFIYKYNQDPGMMNPEFEYVIGVENSRMVPEFTAASRELFGYRQVARKRNGEYIYDQDGNIVVDWERNHNFTPQRSSMTFDLVMTDFGAHIVMYTRTLSDFIYNTNTRGITRADGSIDLRLVNFDSFERAVNSMLANPTSNLLFAPLTSYGNQFGEVLFPASKQTINAPAKTWFDLAVERMNQPQFETKRNSLLVNFKSQRQGNTEDGKLLNEIRLYRRNFSDMW